MTKEEVVKLLVLIEQVYPSFMVKDETVIQWFEFCSKMEYEKVLAKLKNHIRKSPFPPAIADIAVFSYEESDFPETLETWIKKGRERIERDRRNKSQRPVPAWLAEYTAKKSL